MTYDIMFKYDLRHSFYIRISNQQNAEPNPETVEGHPSFDVTLIAEAFSSKLRFLGFLRSPQQRENESQALSFEQFFTPRFGEKS